MPWLDDLRLDVVYALRSLRRRSGFAAFALLILALGVSATTVMFTVIYSVLLCPLPYPDANRVLALHAQPAGFGEVWGYSGPDAQDIARTARSLRTAEWTYGGGTVSGSGTTEYVEGRLVSASLFGVLGVTPYRGRAFRPEEDQKGGAPVAIISYGLWQRRFGGAMSAVGSAFKYGGKSYTIVGIAPPGFRLEGTTDVITPLGQDADPRLENRGARFLHLIGRLQPRFTEAQARSEIALIGRQLADHYPQSNASLALVTRPLRQEVVGDIGSTLWLLLVAVGLVLGVACVNIASLLLARDLAQPGVRHARRARRWSRPARAAVPHGGSGPRSRGWCPRPVARGGRPTAVRRAVARIVAAR